MNKREIFVKAFKDSIPVLSGYLVLGMGYGIIMHTKGFGALWTGACSLFVYAGAMQFAAVDMLAAGASLWTVAQTTLFVNARHLFYGISMIDRYKNTGAAKPFLIFGLTDETYSLVSREEAAGLPRSYFVWVTLLDYLYWFTGSILGSLFGELIKVDTTGVDFALTALFISIVVEQWKNHKSRIPTLIGFAASISMLLLVGPTYFMIPAMILILIGLTLTRGVWERKGQS